MNKKIVTDKKGNEYLYINFVGNNTQYLIPYIDVNGKSKKYWEHHFISRDTWVSINEKTNFDDYSMSKNDFIQWVKQDNKKHKKILNKYHNSF